jgi:hypothetical protein
MNNIQEEIEAVIETGLNALYPIEDSANQDIRNKVSAFTLLALNGYILIKFPEIQYYMGEDWFRKECYLLQAFDDQEHIDSAYFVPINRIINNE